MRPTRILAIDPGTTESAYVILLSDGTVESFGKVNNDTMLAIIMSQGCVSDRLAIERIASYGMTVGAEVFETCVWTGRFIQQWHHYYGFEDQAVIDNVYRRDVKVHICGDMRAKDTNIRQAIIDRYGPGKDAAIGRKANPGPLYGMKADIWQALGVGLVVADRIKGESNGLATA